MMSRTSRSVSWHKAQWQQIDAYQDKMPHAFLLGGVAGLGKADFAIEMQRQILCRNSTPTDKQVCSATQPCTSCRLIHSNTNPDVFLLDPPEGKQIVIEDIDGLRNFLFTSSHLGGAKVAVMLNATRMNLSATNALLKVLEEPPSGKYLILTTPVKNLLLPTILSRCIKVQFSAPPIVTTQQFLADQGTADYKEIINEELLFAINNFAPYAITAMLTSGKGELISKLNQELEATLSTGKDPKDAIRMKDYQGLDILDIIDLLLWRTEQQTKSLVKLHPKNLSNQNNTSATQQMSQQFSYLFGLRSLLLNQRAMLLRKINPNRELLVQECFIYMYMHNLTAQLKSNHG